MSDTFEPEEITLSADLLDGLVTITLPCKGLELQEIPNTDSWRWLIRVAHTREFDLADWDLLSFMDSEGFTRTCIVRDVRESAPGILTMTLA